MDTNTYSNKMNEERWVTAAFTTDALVADLLLRLKQSSSSSSQIVLNTTSFDHPGTWGDRKSRSKAQQQQQRSPSTPFSWSGGSGGGVGGGGSDGDGESCRISASDRSVKLDLHQNPVMENNIFVQTSCKAEPEIETGKMRFVLPDLNETPTCEELVAL